MIATDTAPAVLYQPIYVEGGTRVQALRAAADPSATPPPLEELIEQACMAVAGWNRRHPSLSVDLVVDLAGCPLDTQRIDHAIRYALARSGLGGDRLRVGAAGFDDDPTLRPVPASRLASLLLPQRMGRLPRRAGPSR